MRRFVGPCLLVFFVFFGGTTYGSNLEKGFLGIKWGQNLNEVSELSELYQRDKVRYFARPGVLYKLRGKYPSRVVYGFYQDRFFAGYVSFRSWEAVSEIRQELTKLYGIPRIKARKDHSIYQWRAKEIKIKLKLWEVKGEMKLAFYYMPLSNQLNEERQEKNFERSLRAFPLDRKKKYEAIPLLIF
ncbi:MAG: hypothetical protein JRJ29_12355 [Deltaproteobacteria bacterium]|nr:hypothetical protein [Deltaproteobacteria bacterium]